MKIFLNVFIFYFDLLLRKITAQLLNIFESK